MQRLLTASLIAVACLVTPAGARAQHGPAAATGESARPSSTLSSAAHAMRDSVVALARAQLGRRYAFGEEDPERGFDCSGLVLYIMQALGMELPRTAAQQARAGQPIARDPSQLWPGDLVTFGADSIEHIGIYVGDGRFIHASSVAGRVIESAIQRPRAPLIKPWAGVRRIAPPLATRGAAAARDPS